jgi:hypothetical protein
MAKTWRRLPTKARQQLSDERLIIPSSYMCCSSTQRRRAFAGRHVFVLASSSGLRGHKRTYRTILESADHAFFKMVRYVLLRPLRQELDAKTKTCLPAKTRFCHLDEQANSQLTHGLFICSWRQLVISSKAMCLRVSKTERYGLSRIYFEMTLLQATMPSLEGVSLPCRWTAHMHYSILNVKQMSL